jgi:hypothetical protein
VNNPEPFDFNQARAGLSRIAQQLRDSEDFHRTQVERLADAEAAYRKGLAQAYVRHRADGKGAGEADVLSKGDCADLSRERDIAAGMVRAALEALENRRGDRASLHRLADWSQRFNPEGEQVLRRAA